MVTFQDFTARFPEMLIVPEARFNIFFRDSQVIMGKNESRWLNLYDMAQAYLIAHLTTVGSITMEGDTNPLAPLSRTDVDDVQVEYAVNSVTSGTSTEYQSTSYGQRYTQYRAMVFAGPRIA
ncbi:DUF4054 domain-containing protein [Hafnia alvei]|nr:DUF4054 domain-containing protein [Hafnia alvei]MBI0275414.1 DUF4054 domain-containing protein [Hafnia alvei]